MTTAEWIHAIKAIEAKNDSSIASHRQRKAARRAAALESIRSMSDTMITPEMASEVIGCDPQYIRLAARRDPEALGFPVTISGNRTSIPRARFLRYVEGE